MNQFGRVEAYKMRINNGNEALKEANYKLAHDEFVAAAEICKDLYLETKNSYYFKLTNDLLEIAKTKCCKPEAKVNASSTAKADESGESPFKPTKVKELVSFDDVAGLEDVKKQVRVKVKKVLDNPKMAEYYGIDSNVSILLYGPPGNGKTMIAKAIAHEIDSVFFNISCADIRSKYIGDSSKNIQALFKEARKHKRATIFFDEFESIASKRDSEFAHPEDGTVVDELLKQMDGIVDKGENETLLLIAATNVPWSIDSALLRGGRFGTQIYVGIPDEKARIFMIKKALKNVKLADDLSVEMMSQILEGYGGGDITHIVKSALVNLFERSDHEGQYPLSSDDFEAALKNARKSASKELLQQFEDFRNNY